MSRKYLTEEFEEETGEITYKIDIKKLVIDNLIDEINKRKNALNNGVKDENAKKILKESINDINETLLFLKDNNVKYKYSNLYIYDRRTSEIKKAKYNAPFMNAWINDIDNEPIPESIVLGIDLLKIIRPYNYKILNDYKNPKRKLGTALMEITSILYDDTGRIENKKFIIAFYFEKLKDNEEEISKDDIVFDF